MSVRAVREASVAPPGTSTPAGRRGDVEGAGKPSWPLPDSMRMGRSVDTSLCVPHRMSSSTRHRVARTKHATPCHRQLSHRVTGVSRLSVRRGHIFHCSKIQDLTPVPDLEKCWNERRDPFCPKPGSRRRDTPLLTIQLPRGPALVALTNSGPGASPNSCVELRIFFSDPAGWRTPRVSLSLTARTSNSPATTDPSASGAL